MYEVESHRDRPDRAQSEKYLLLLSRSITYEAICAAANADLGFQYGLFPARLGPAPREVDCTYSCELETAGPGQVDAEDSALTCLVGLVCWPFMLCYRPEKTPDCSTESLLKTPSVAAADAPVESPSFAVSAFDSSVNDHWKRAGEPLMLSNGRMKKIGVV